DVLAGAPYRAPSPARSSGPPNREPRRGGTASCRAVSEGLQSGEQTGVSNHPIASTRLGSMRIPFFIAGSRGRRYSRPGTFLTVPRATSTFALLALQL